MTGRLRELPLCLLILAAWVAPAAADRVHVVEPGESLWQIAGVMTGNPYRWPELYRANRDQIKDPTRLYPGQRLAVPEFGPWLPGNTPDVEAAAAPSD